MREHKINERNDVKGAGNATHRSQESCGIAGADEVFLLSEVCQCRSGTNKLLRVRDGGMEIGFIG
jgi:hypothetical protein